MNAASGAKIQNATTSAPIDMPAIKIVAPGAAVSVAEGATAMQVIGIYGSGANSAPLTVATSGSATFSTTTGLGTAVHDSNMNTITVPAAAVDAPVSYLVKYTRPAESGIKLVNQASEFPPTVTLTLYCSIVDPCSDALRAAYVVISSLQWSPETTISLSADEQEMDLSGSIQINGNLLS